MTDTTKPAAGSLVVELDRNQVSLLIQCNDRYAAMELYDRAIKMAHDGHLRLDLTLNGVASEH